MMDICPSRNLGFRLGARPESRHRLKSQDQRLDTRCGKALKSPYLARVSSKGALPCHGLLGRFALPAPSTELRHRGCTHGSEIVVWDLESRHVESLRPLVSRP